MAAMKAQVEKYLTFNKSDSITLMEVSFQDKKMERQIPGKKEFYKQLDQEVKDYEAQKDTIDMGMRDSLTDHPHSFRLVKGNEVQCTCGWGIFLDSKDEFKDGHIYREGRLII